MGKKFMGLGGTDHFWDRAKAWILNQITSAVTAKIAEIVANAPEDLDTLKEIADWITEHTDDAAAMNTQITENKNNIAANSSSISAMNTQITENKNNIAALQTSVAGKADTEHTHSASDITSGTLPVGRGGTGVTTQADINKAFIGNLDVGNSDVTDGTEFVSSWASDNGFAETAEGAVNTPYKRQFIKVWNYIKDKIASVLGLTANNYGGTAATILDYARGTPIKVRWGGPGIDSADWYPAFNADGSVIGPINRTNIHAGTATSDANGNNIVNTYATKTELEKTTTKGVSLSTVTTNTTKYIKLGTFKWYDSFSFKCRIAGDTLEENINVNILSGNSSVTSVCGYYSTNSGRTKSIIVKRGGWNSNFEIYLKIVQLTTAEVYVTIDKNIQDRINISESTTAPSGTLEEIAFSNRNGMFSSNIDAAGGLKVNQKMVIPIGAPSSLEDGCIWIER